jgi:hypothetical protein
MLVRKEQFWIEWDKTSSTESAFVIEENGNVINSIWANDYVRLMVLYDGNGKVLQLDIFEEK